MRAQKLDGAASLQAIVDGGSRGRRYGSSLRDLGSLEMVAQRLVQEELLNDSGADFASVSSSEQTGGLGSTSYYDRALSGGWEAGHCKTRSRAAAALLHQNPWQERRRRLGAFFEREGGTLLSDMEAIAQSFGVRGRELSSHALRGLTPAKCQIKMCARYFGHDNRWETIESVSMSRSLHVLERA